MKARLASVQSSIGGQLFQCREPLSVGKTMLPLAIRKLSCNPLVRGVAHHLHITHFARGVYCRFLARNGELRVSCLGVDAVFKTRNSKQLAFVDYILTTERDAIEAALCHLRAGHTFLDVGSHYGIFSILASKLVGPTGKVIAVEPHDGARQVLRENLALNHCENIEVLSFAFSDKTGPVALTYHENGVGLQPSSDPSSTLNPIQGMAGDEALRDFPIPSVVKIDVEGHEFAVLNGLKRTLSNKSCRLLSVEIHPSLLPPGINKDSILTFVQEQGFNFLSQAVRSMEVQVVASR
jgi:FkbM family methyltransferase